VEILTPGSDRKQSYKVLRRERLGVGTRLSGPCLVLSTSSTALIPEGWNGLTDEIGSIDLEKGV
jgi:hypothetical protein